MKKLLVFLLLICFTGCSTLYPVPIDPVCSQPEATGSIICATAQWLSLTPEQMDAAFLDAALLGIGTKAIQATKLRSAVLKTQTWVRDRNILTINGLVKYLVSESTVDPALALLLSRRLGLINLPDLGIQPITPYDKNLILTGLQHQLDQLSFF